MEDGKESVLKLPVVRRVFRGLLAVEILLLLLHGVLVFGFPAASRPLRQFVNVALPDNLPTWFSSVQLAGVGVLCLICGGLVKTWLRRWGWRILGALFLALSVDEMCEVHEKLGDILAARLREGRLPGWMLEASEAWRSEGGFLWILYLGPFLLLAALVAVLWLRSALRGTPGAFRMAAGGFGVMILSQGLEVLQGVLEKHAWAATANVSMALEEFLEMLGATLLLAALLAHALRLGPGGSQSSPPSPVPKKAGGSSRV